MILSIIAGLMAFAVSIYLFLISNFNYWKKFGVNGPKPGAFVGNYPNLYTQKRHIAYDIQDIYDCLLTSGELMRRIFVVDFKHFHDNELSLMIDEKSDFIFGMNPFISRGEKWKQRRSEVTPGLTGNRIKAMFATTNRVCQRMTEYINEQIKMGPKDGIDAKDLSLRFTSEIVTDIAWGLEAESFTAKPSPIRDTLNSLFESSPIGLAVYSTAITMWPKLKEIFKTRFIPKKFEQFFVKYVKDAVDIRKSQISKGLNVNRIDYLNYMLQLQEKKGISMKHLTATTMTFIFDGYETTAGVLAFGRDLERQKKLRTEISENLKDTNDFDTIMSLPYLDACIHESLRIFPALLSANKVCTEPIELTNKNGNRFVVPKDTVVILPTHSIMADGEIYENPNSFEPERFLEENGGLKKYKDMGAYYAFGDGPRTCVGMRFALSQLKGSLVEIISNFEVVVNSKTSKGNEFDPKYFLTRLKGGIWLDFKRL